ncbi:MAG: DMT family transporter [Bordetella sp.]|nr:DMT family transporter [Bordetella sp.]
MAARNIAYLELTLAMVLVGSTVVAGKLAGATVAPLTATALRLALALPAFLLLLRWRRTPLPALDRHDRVLLCVQAAAGSVGYTAFLLAGLARLPAADAGIVLGTLPAVSALLAATLPGERAGAATWLAVALATMGVLLVSGARSGAAGVPLDPPGLALVLGAVVCEAAFILGARWLRTPLPPVLLSTLLAALGLPLALAGALLFEAPWRARPDAQAWAALLYYALVPTVAGFVLWYSGLARLGAGGGTRAAVFTAFAPVSAVLLSALVLREPLLPAQLAGMGCVAAAAMAAAAPRPQRPTA